MSKTIVGALVVIGFAGFAATARCNAQAVDRARFASDSGLYLKVRLASPVKTAKLKPGDVVQGALLRDVYSVNRKLFSAGSPVHLVVDHTEKRRRVPNDHWPWVVKAFTPRQETYPVFQTATISQPGGEASLPVTLIAVTRLREIHPEAKKKKPGQATTEEGSIETRKTYSDKTGTPTVVLEADASKLPAPNAELGIAEEPGESESLHAGTLPSGTRCKILLLGNVSASKSKPGDLVHARLLEPVMLDSKVVLPAGSLFEGRVVKTRPPRWLSRAGSLYLTFTEVTLPEGSQFSLKASLAGAELARASHTRMDPEGQLHGERPGNAWMAINLGVTAGLTKEVDDSVQLVIEAIVSSATDASTAGTARIVSSCISGLYLVTRHGRDVILPRFTEMDIALDRPLSVTAPLETATASAAAGAK